MCGSLCGQNVLLGKGDCQQETQELKSAAEPNKEPNKIKNN